MVYDGEIVEGLPNGFGRMMYYCSGPEQVKSIVGNFVKGVPQGKCIKFVLGDESVEISITFVIRSLLKTVKQGIVLPQSADDQKPFYETDFDNLKWNDGEVKNFKDDGNV